VLWDLLFGRLVALGKVAAETSAHECRRVVTDESLAASERTS